MNKAYVVIGWCLVIIGIIFMLNSSPGVTGFSIYGGIEKNTSIILGFAGLITGIILLVITRKKEDILT